MTQEFTPEQKIKWIMLDLALKQDYIETIEDITADNVDDLYDEFRDDLQDVKYEVRSGTVETGLHSEYSRHYESKAVATQAPDGTWVGWTYWYGGVWRCEPEAIDWMEEAYNIECSEETKLVVVRTFTQKE